MNVCACPHCGNLRIVVSKVPKDVVAVLSCPSCHELVVLFRKKVIGVNRQILEQGSREERTRHFAEILEQFLDPGIFSSPPSGFAMETDSSGEEDMGQGEPESIESDTKPISKRDVERFAKFDLQRIDDATYFKRHFGGR
ncbi:MAG: hypothetical protein AMXMBFR84_36360 [Candidatus Hydrogenedentota bacterium]